MKDDNVKISSLAFGLLIIFAIIGVSVVIGFGIDIVEPIFIRYGTYFLCGFFLLAAALQVFFALLGLGGGYFLREMPFIIPAFLAFMVLFPLFIGTYPSINTDGGKYYYTFILTFVFSVRFLQSQDRLVGQRFCFENNQVVLLRVPT